MKRLLVATLMIAAVGIAQTQPPPESQPQGQPAESDQADAANHGVARISFMNGNVSVRRADSGELVAAIMNVPLMVGDRLVTGEGARAEVQLDSANLVRMGPATEIRFSDLQQGRYQIQVAAGTVSFRVLRDSNAQVEISTPSVSAHPMSQGVYRITVKGDGSSEITVRSGQAEMFSPTGSEQLPAGSTMLSRGSASDPEFQVIGALPEDEFDRWSAGRDQHLERAVSPRYVSPEITGTEDLDNNGRWVNDGSYGNVWVPSVDPGWAPYRCGRWVWMDFYGWTWVGCESWGWAPYHYGRWYMGSFGWAWWPGPMYSHYYWRPALVGFFGWGGPGIGVGFGFGFGNVGWVPLAPFERFSPWYGRGFVGGRGVIVNNVNVVNNFRNARVMNGVTSMRAGEFGRGTVSNSNFVRAGAGDLSRAGLARGPLGVTPSGESRQFTNRAASTQGMPRTSENTRFVSRSQPSAQRIGGAAGNNGGWQRMGQGTRQSAPQGPGGLRSGGQSQPQRSPQGAQSSSYNRGYSSPQQQPVRINPSIVQNRSAAPSNSSGSRPSGGSSSRPSGGGSRGSGGGGGSHGGGGHK
jgi:hypothetical protein